MGSSSPSPHVLNVAHLLTTYRTFATEVRAAILRCERALRSLSTPDDPVVLWQGASKTVGFLSALPHIDMIHCAIDVNPLTNPYVTKKIVSPKAGEAYVDRTKPATGLITADTVIYKSFTSRGWTWGGSWSQSPRR